jgi:hypothetical protein
MGLNLKAHHQGSQVIVGLVTAKCAKLDEYNAWSSVNVPYCGLGFNG